MLEQITNPVIAKIAEMAAAKGYTLTSLALAANLSNGTLTKKANALGAPNMMTLRKVAGVLECDVRDFFAAGETKAQPQKPKVNVRSHGHTRDLPIRGTAAGAAIGSMNISQQVVEWAYRPHGLEGVPDAYAIFVKGESMVPRHNPGELRCVHPHRMPREGDTVIIETQNYEGGPVEAFIKLYVRENATEIITKQEKPAGTIQFKKKYVIGVHKVLSLNEILGV